MIGQTVGKYRVEDRIGRGGMGTVYRAVDETLRREVAIKVLNSELNDPEVAKRFRAEAITVAKLNHAGIATVYELFEHDGQWLMVMEFVRGETLERLIERAGPLSAERAADLCAQALAALTHAHGLGVVHRDLKPANLMLTEAGAVKIMDFGIARVSGSEHLTSAGFMMGTPAYMAPEQVLGQEVDARADLYAMGVVLYRLTTAKLPFKGDTPFALAQSQVNDAPTPVLVARDGLPAWLDQVLTRALSKPPADRFQTAQEFRETLRRCLAGLPLDTPLSGSTAPTGMMLTPTGLPSGSFGMHTPSGSGAIRSMQSGAQQAPGGMTASSMAPTAHHPTPAYLSTAPTMSVQQTMSSTSSSTMAPAQPPQALPSAAPTGATPIAPAKPATAAKLNNTVMIAIAAGVVVVLTIGGFFMFRHGTPAPAPAPPPTTVAQDQAPQPAPVPDPNATAPIPAGAPGTTAAGNAPPAAAGTTPPAPSTSSAASASGASGAGSTTGTKPAANSSTPAGTGPGSANPAGTPGAAGANAKGTAAPNGPGAIGAAQPVDPALAGRAGARGTNPADATKPAPGPVDDSLVVFSDAKLLTFDGKKGHDQDVTVNFGSGQISVLSRKGGAPIVALPYRKIAHATYVHAKDPKWDATLPGLPDGMDIPGFMRGSRNWVVFQTKTDYTVIFLDDTNYSQLLTAFEARTGLKIDRPDGGK